MPIDRPEYIRGVVSGEGKSEKKVPDLMFELDGRTFSGQGRMWKEELPGDKSKGIVARTELITDATLIEKLHQKWSGSLKNLEDVSK